MESAVIRAPTRRRARNDEQLYGRIKLKKILGLTVCSNAALDVSPISGLLAYPAGCTVILFNAKKQTQAYLVNTSRKAITAVAFSRCGRYVATGECGLNPAIKVWELDSPNGSLEDTTGGNVVAEFIGHKYAVSCVAFSPTGKYLVSVGSQHDMIVNVFDWKSNLKMASNKVSAKVSAVSFSEDGSYFVTVGNRHVKYWYLDGGRKQYKDPVPLMGRSAILGELRNNDFCAVACGKGEFFDSTYAITRQGHLVEFNSRRLLDKWVACRTTSANCICVNAQFILVGCAESIIRIFNASTLEYVTTLPRTHYLGVDVAAGVHINHIMNVPHNAKYPDCVAMVYDASRAKVSCVYNDHSLYIWDMRDIKRVGKSHSFLYHSTCIWGVETVPYNLERELSQTLPEECFLTCSSDDTIRVWGLDGCSNNEIYRKNIYSKDLLKVVYIDEELNFIRDCDNSVMATDKSSYDGRNGVRCIKISPELSHLATGDRSGNIRIYNLANLKMLTIIEAHDSEVLCLEYTNDKIDRKLLASASRDRLIHVFDVNQGYVILQTLDDHSSSITSIKFVGSGLTFQMISCGADKSIMFRTFQNSQFLRGTNCSGKTTLYDMEVDSNSKHIMTACQDRNIRVYSTQSQKHTKTFKGSHSEDGSLIKLSLDPSGIYVATSCTDKTLSVYDYYSNECMARMYGHSELVTGLAFTNDCKYLISASGDGCVFVWQIPHDMIVTMQARLSQQRLRSGHPPLARPISEIIVESPIPEDEKFGMSPGRLFMDDIPLTPGYKFSDVGQLPQWAKRKTSATEEPNAPPSLSSSPSQVIGVPKPRGRWAQRGQIDSDTLDLRSNSESPLGAPPYSGGIVGNTQTSDYNSASSKDIMYNQTYLSEDSSIDSGMETRREIKFVGVTGNGSLRPMPEKKKTSNTVSTSLRFESNNDHDGDVEDISDGERTSSDHGLFYPTISPGTPTEFKVNAMNEEELRKSMRRKNFEKVGLNLSGGSHTASTGTGTGTSDTEDEGSTPSGENADRSIASTLGGSSENIPQVSSSFLQQALDGPGGFPERGDRTRRSISAKHNTEKSPSITKSYTSTKKEELLKVISEAKQKLENGQRNFKNGIIKNNAIPEVGYRPLRGSHSISDLSLAASSENPRTTNRYIKAGYKTQTSSNIYFNCAASKSVLTQNCNVMRQLHQNYPPYPRHIGVYTATTSLTPSTVQLETSKQKSNSSTCPRAKSTTKSSSSSNNQEADDSNYNNTSQSKSQSRKSQSILKNYKSCPVSPVHEEIDWRNLPSNNKNIIFTEPKRHSVYSDDARTILDMIHTDTERMIEEITKKYGDLDEPQTNLLSTSASVPHNLSNTRSLPLPQNHHHHGASGGKKKDKDSPKDEDGNFSSDSLENCSLDLDYEQNHCNGRKKKVCKKHQKKATTIPKRSVSEYFIYKEFYDQSIHRNVSLSDILNDDPTSKPNNDHLEEAKFLETQRHSSASFFLTQYPDKKSQESLLSDDFGDVSYYNSMESILSDESDCKSAPLEMLFDKKRLRNPCTHLLHERVMDNVSKSYGSSPNTYSSLDFYMQQRSSVNCTYEAFDVSGYGLNEFSDKTRGLNQPTSIPIHSSETYPRLSDCLPPKSPINDDDIPTMKYKNAQYNSGVNKSLSKEFASERQKKNPLTSEEYDDYMFTKKPVGEKPPVPAKPQSLITSVLSGGAPPATPPTVSAPSSSVKKSCSFDVDIKDMKAPSRTASVVRKFERNLAKFEREKQQQNMRTSASSGALSSSTGSCLKSSQKSLNTDGGASRRASSMRSRSRPKISVRFNTVSQIKYTPSDKRSSSCSSSRSSENRTDYEEKSFEMYISENGNERDNNMDSLKLYTKPPPLVDEVQDDKSKKNSLNEKTYVLQPSLDNNTSNQCRNIAKKIDIINKLIEMEEKKLEQIRLATENRMKPFQCNSKEKGYVKSLTMNFDKLARGIERDIETEQNRIGCGSDGGSEFSKMTRNISLPDVLESVKLQAYNFITANTDEHESEKIRIDCGGKDKGTTNKNIMPIQIEDSSIRRACSLSDLHMGNMGKSPKSNGTPVQLQKTGSNYRPSPVSRSVSKRNSLQGPKSTGSSLTTQSGSMNVLNNGSDSDPEETLRGGSTRTSTQSQSRSNGPIAASRQYNNKATTITSSRRKGLQSSFNNGSGQQDDSSSEETPGTSSTHSSKPVVPPRPRNLSLDHKKTVMNSPNVVKSRGNFEPVDFPSRDIDQSDPKSQVYNIINKLYTTTTAAMQLHAKLKNCEDSPTSTGNNNLMLKELENAVIMTQQMLTNITNKNDKNSSQNLSSSFSGHEVNLENGDFLTMVNNCADLLSNVRSKHKPDDCENNS